MIFWDVDQERDMDKSSYSHALYTKGQRGESDWRSRETPINTMAAPVELNRSNSAIRNTNQLQDQQSQL